MEEYKRCSPLLREWLEFVVKIYKIDQSELSIRECIRMGVSDTSITLTNWNTLERNVIDAIYVTAVAEDFKGVVVLVDEFFTIRSKILNMRINRSYVGEKLVYNKEKIFVTLALYSGFAKYKLGDYEEHWKSSMHLKILVFHWKLMKAIMLVKSLVNLTMRLGLLL